MSDFVMARFGQLPMNKALFGRIRALLTEQMGGDEASITLDTRLGRDLGMDGADAEEFLTAYRQEFGVDMTDFPYDDYFGPEVGFEIFTYLYCLLFKRSALKQKQVTVSELMAAAEAKRWPASSPPGGSPN